MQRLGWLLAAALMIGAGFAAASALWGEWDALTGRPLAYADARRVCLLRAWDETLQRETFDMPLAAFLTLAPEASSFEHLAAYRYWSAGFARDGRRERVQAYRVTADMFPLLGVAPLLGRTLQPADARALAPKVAVLSHDFWLRRFGGAADVLGRELRLDGEPHVIVGVMPARFEFPLDSFKGELWTPLAVDAAAALRDPGSAGTVVAIGRLRAGRSTRAAEAEVRAALARHAARDRGAFRSLAVRVIPLEELRSAGAAAGLRLARWALAAQVGGATLFQ
jgi:hypothetical protein